ncbi:hypothetical protein Q8F55_007157 [Vanrija albida]|uniref:BZIP domain-containing protein n=1 Tax=Vanrija albida TaxID=181172 RepID=A0ABR3PZ04_9TREE
MYAPFQYAFHDSAQGSQPVAPQYSLHHQAMHHAAAGSMTDSDHTPTLAHSSPAHVPALHVTHATPTRLRSRRAAAAVAGGSGDRAPNALEVSVEPYDDADTVMTVKSEMAPRGAKPAMTDEDARKQRKREMGRERQRRKRLRDKEKREAAKAAVAATGEPMPFPSGSRSTLAPSSLAFDNLPSSASSTYSNLPPMGISLSPTTSFAMSAGSTSMSESSSPSHSFSPIMSTPGGINFADDPAWQEHTAVFGNLSLSPDATVRAKPRPSSIALASVTASRRPSDQPEFQPFGLHADQRPSPAKRRKSDSEDERHARVGLGVIIDPELEGVGPFNPGRPVSDHSHSSLDDPMEPSPDRSPTPPPVGDLPAEFRQFASRSMVATRGAEQPSPEGVFFSSAVVLALHDSQWGEVLETKLGIKRKHLEAMATDIAAAYEKWRVHSGTGQVTLDPATRMSMTQSPTTSASPNTSSAFHTPSQPSRAQDGAPLKSPSTSSTASDVAPLAAVSRSSSTPSIPTTMRLTQVQMPETPQSKPSSSSSTTSPVQPTLQTPLNGQGRFAPQWSNATAPPLGRPYEGGEWRGAYQHHTLSSPITSRGKDGAPPGINIMPAPVHLQSAMPSPGAPGSSYAHHAEFHRASMAGYSPATPVNQRHLAGVPIFYNPQFQNPLAPPHGPGLQSSPPGLEGPHVVGADGTPVFTVNGRAA